MSYRQFVAHGPLVHQELLHALEEERLVFFCGAGISVDTDLPTFAGLVDEAFDEFAISRHPESTNQGEALVPDDPVLAAAYRRQEYDRVLNILEDEQGDTGQLRRFVMKRLTRRPPNRDALALHRAVLDLARLRADPLRGPRGFRLVTTNFDDRFELAGLEQCWIEAAPRLPRPKLEQPGSVVYLHGRIETKESKRDPNGQTLVLSSADFGDAYLRDGYAARFVLELFRSFTVVFIGYGLNDPVMRYLVDAIAAESGPDGQFRGAYAFIDHSGLDVAEQAALWRAKHVTPIPYNKKVGERPHRLLRNSLVNWAREHTTGLSGRLQVALGPTNQPFVPGRDDGEPVNHLANVAWALSEPNGVIARQFAAGDAETEDGYRGRHISWLGPLLNFEILDPRRAKLRKGETCRLFELPEVACALAVWAASNLNHEALLSWLLEPRDRPELRADAFRMQLCQQVEFNLGRNPPAPPFSNFWRVMVEILTTNPNGALWLQAPKNPASLLDCRAVLRALRPRLSWPRRSLHRALAATAGETLEPKRVADVADFELLLGEQHASHLLEKLQSTPDDSFKALLLDDLTSLLLEALDLAAAADLGTARGYSDVERPSIVPSEANPEYSNWTRLFDVLVDACRAAARTAPSFAHAAATRWHTLWQSRRQMLLARLYLFAAAEILPSADGASFVLADSELLWSAEAEFEVSEYLKARSGEMADDVRQALELALFEGPPRSLFGDLPPEDYTELADQNKARLLRAMQSSGVRLTIRVREFLEEYTRRSGTMPEPSKPQVRLAVSHLPSPSAARLVGRPAHEIAIAIRDHRSEHGFNQDREAGELLGGFLRSEPERAIEIFSALLDAGEDRLKVWGVAFWTLTQLNGGGHVLSAQACTTLASALEARPVPVHAALHDYSDWLRGFAQATIEDRDFWRLWDLACEQNAIERNSALVETELSVNGAANAPAGRLTEAVLIRRWSTEPQPSEGLGDDFSGRLSMLVSSDAIGGRYARIRAVRWLVQLFWLDPKWTRQYLLRRMEWGVNEQSATELWRAFFFDPRASPELVETFESDFLAALGRRPVLGDRAHANGCRFFAEIVATDPGLVSRDRAMNALRQMGPEGVRAVLDRFSQLLDNSEQPATLWRETICPWIASCWPPDRQLRTSRTFGAAAKLALATREAFEEAVDALMGRDLVGQIDRNHTLFVRLTPNQSGNDRPTYNYALEHGHAFSRWLSAVLPVQINPWEKDALRAIIAELEDAGKCDGEALARLRQRVL